MTCNSKCWRHSRISLLAAGRRGRRGAGASKAERRGCGTNSCLALREVARPRFQFNNVKFPVPVSPTIICRLDHKLGKYGLFHGVPGFFNWFLALESPTSFQFQVFRENSYWILFLKLHEISETGISGNSTRHGQKMETSKSVSHVKIS